MFNCYHLVMTNITVYTWPIEIDGLPFLKMVDWWIFPWQTVNVIPEIRPNHLMTGKRITLGASPQVMLVGL